LSRGLIALVQKAGRAFERAKKRVAMEQACENRAGEGELGDQVGGRVAKRAKVAMGVPRHSGRRGE
jgi:hypothetical protein